jgi:hypothetical protein
MYRLRDFCFGHLVLTAEGLALGQDVVRSLRSKRMSSYVETRPSVRPSVVFLLRCINDKTVLPGCVKFHTGVPNSAMCSWRHDS